MEELRFQAMGIDPGGTDLKVVIVRQLVGNIDDFAADVPDIETAAGQQQEGDAMALMFFPVPDPGDLQTSCSMI